MIKRSEKIKNLCKEYLKYGKDILNGDNCNGISCGDCPFSNYNNNGILCTYDYAKHYNEIAKEYLREYGSDDDSICFEEEDIVETLYHVGDKVKIREDLEIDECYEECCFVDDMEEFKGEIVTISEAYVGKYDGKDKYHIKEDDGEFCWTNDMFEVVNDDDYIEDDEEEKERVPKYKIGDKVRVKKDLVIDRFYDGVTFCMKMNDFKGEIVTIATAHTDKISDNYEIEEDGELFCWTNSMFEDVDDEDEEITKQETIDILDKTLNFIEDNHIDFIQGNIIYDVMKGDKEYLESAKKWLDMLIMRN